MDGIDQDEDPTASPVWVLADSDDASSSPNDDGEVFQVLWQSWSADDSDTAPQQQADGSDELDGGGAAADEASLYGDSPWTLPAPPVGGAAAGGPQSEPQRAPPLHPVSTVSTTAAAAAAPRRGASSRGDEPAAPMPRTKRARRNYGHTALSAEQVEALLLTDLPARPLALDLVATPQAEPGGWVFKETGKRTRPADPRADKWRRGGGAGDATDLPSAEEPRVRRRYGYLISQDGETRLRYHQYCRLTPAIKPDRGGSRGGGSRAAAAEDTRTWLFHVMPEAPAASPLASPSPRAGRDRARDVATMLPGEPTAAAAAAAAASPVAQTTHVVGSLRVQQQQDHSAPLLQLESVARPAGATTDFVRFEEAGTELGGIYHSDHGLQLRSAAGDFAEWHPARVPSELPYAEGSVVGLFNGEMCLSTDRADVVGVVSRRAMCVGSFPGKEKALQGDIVAYLGQVPVRVRGPVSSGDLLVPSGLHNGLAIARSADADSLAVVGVAMSGLEGAATGMVDVMITPPSAQQQNHTKIDPADEFAMFQASSANKRIERRTVWQTCLIAVVVGLVMASVVLHTLSSMPSPQHLEPPEEEAHGPPLHHAPATHNNCTMWPTGCGLHGSCVAAQCECSDGYAGDGCDDRLCDGAAAAAAATHEKPARAAGCPAGSSCALSSSTTSTSTRNSVCWPDQYELHDRDGVAASTVPMHVGLMGVFRREARTTCSGVPVYKREAATTRHCSIGDPSGCIEGSQVPAFLFLREADQNHSHYWAIAFGSSESGYTELNCKSNSVAFMNSEATVADAIVTGLGRLNQFLPPTNVLSQYGTMSSLWTPCQSNPAGHGCNRKWMECIGDVLYPPPNGILACPAASLASLVGRQVAHDWSDAWLWRTVGTLSVLAVPP